MAKSRGKQPESTEQKAALQLFQFSAGGGSSRDISNNNQCTERLDEYNWSFPTEKDPNINISTKEDSSMNIEKNAKILKHYPEVTSDGEIIDKMGCVNKQRKFRSTVDIYEATN